MWNKVDSRICLACICRRFVDSYWSALFDRFFYYKHACFPLAGRFANCTPTSRINFYTASPSLNEILATSKSSFMTDTPLAITYDWQKKPTSVCVSQEESLSYCKGIEIKKKTLNPAAEIHLVRRSPFLQRVTNGKTKGSSHATVFRAHFKILNWWKDIEIPPLKLAIK